MLTRGIEELLTSEEVCRILRCSRRTLYNLTHYYKKRPPVLHPIMVRGSIRFRPSALDDYLRRMEIR
jgi:excisionase family DNA binding protein